ncbi:MAG: tetratricopeptide repeat protein [Pseudomonadales bacterium]|jgi:predicted negative regulator of RcsB-dependent stress response|nr:tetratricopeptide repeat protein [Pseudomonadales bacterium]
MADYRTEEEQIELIKKWWRENGRSTVVGVGVALVLFFGWMQWQAYQKKNIEAASDLFQQMLTATEAVDGAQKVTALAEQLRKEYPHTVYGTFAGLRLAKDAVAANNLTAAVQFLEWVQQQKPDASLQPLVNLRLAQVQFAQNDSDKALATLNAIKSGGVAWEGEVAELRGDIFAAQSKTEEARASYQEAKQVFDTAGNRTRTSALEVKLSTLPSAAASKNAVDKQP